jgi:hypothetical protein
MSPVHVRIDVKDWLAERFIQIDVRKEIGPSPQRQSHIIWPHLSNPNSYNMKTQVLHPLNSLASTVAHPSTLTIFTKLSM